jgi:hypothetical protein
LSHVFSRSVCTRHTLEKFNFERYLLKITYCTSTLFEVRFIAGKIQNRSPTAKYGTRHTRITRVMSVVSTCNDVNRVCERHVTYAYHLSNSIAIEPDDWTSFLRRADQISDGPQRHTSSQTVQRGNTPTHRRRRATRIENRSTTTTNASPVGLLIDGE